MHNNLIEHIRKMEPDYIRFLRELVEQESPTGDKVLVDRLIDFVEQFLVKEHIPVTRIPQEDYGDFLKAEWSEGEKQIMLLGHLDTVWPAGTLENFPFEVKNGIVTGPGTYDMKCGIMQFICAMRIMKELGLRSRYRIVLFINTDEETGSPASRPFIEEEALKSACVCVGEGALSHKGLLKTERSGLGSFELHITGIPAHAGSDPDKGASAIHEFARQVGYLESISRPEAGTTINVGTVHGGTAANVIAEHLDAAIDLRFRTKDEAERVIPLIRGMKPFDKRTRITVHERLTRLPMEKTEGNTRLFNRVREIASGMGIDVGEASTGGISDANITSSLGVPTVDGLGAVGGGLHSRDEHLYTEHIPQRIALLVNLLTGLE